MPKPSRDRFADRWSVVVLVAMAACEQRIDPEAPPPDIYAHDTALPEGIVDPAFTPDPSPAIDLSRKALTLVEDEVIVIEGAPELVTAGGGGFGVVGSNERAIVREVLSRFPDRFDTIAIFLSFTDQAHVGTAFYSGIANGVQGIGREVFNGRSSWGLPSEGRLSGFVNMNGFEMWGDLDTLVLPFSGYHAVLAQELSHRWLMFMKFKDGSGAVSDALLGRMDAHWSPLVDADGSVQDGYDWRDNGDGSFDAIGSENGFAPADLYAMGIFAKEEVPTFFHIVEASLNDMPVDKTSRIPRGARLRGRRVDVTADSIIAALGPRNPPKGTETPYYRAAFVLITAPGEPRAEWAPELEALKRLQLNFPETWKTWTLRAGALCTKVTELCPEPDLSLHGFSVSDGGDNLVGPGESFDLSLVLRNDGIGTAANVQVLVTPITAGVQVLTATVTVPAIAELGTAPVASPVRVSVADSLACGETIALRVRSTSQEGPSFRDTLDMVIGNETLRADPLHEAPDWHVDPDGDDGATTGRWELGEPEFISILGVITQPGEDHSPGDGKLSFHTGLARGESFSAQDVDGGETTLESPVFSIGGARDPSLVFYVWHVAMNFAPQTGPEPVPQGALRVLASNDGGESYVEIGNITENTKEWTRVAIRLRPMVEPSNRMRFRFAIGDPTEAGTVEAGIDDLELIDVLATCPVEGEMPDAGTSTTARRPRNGGCSAAGQPASSIAILAIVLAAIFRRRR